MCLSRFWLIQSSIAAIVELLPEPVAPQTRRMPSFDWQNLINGSAARLKILEFRHPALDVPEDDAHEPALMEGVDAKATDFVGRIGEIPPGRCPPRTV